MRLGGFLTLLAVSPLLVLALAAAPAEGTIGTIQPGDRMTSGGAGCTLNFVFDGVGPNEGKVYLGTAAHCVDGVGARVSSWPYENFGFVAYRADDCCSRTDFAFIEVRPEFVQHVRAQLKGHPQYPTGYTTPEETQVGDLVQMSGYGTVFGSTTPTQEQRVAFLTYDDATQHQLGGPAVFGDSGGPLVHVATGKALGIVSRLCGAWTCTEVGPTVQGMIEQAAADGFHVTVRTVAANG